MIDEIKEKIDIVDFIGQYLQLKKAGANYRALCPFHHEKTPSFFVSPSRQLWRCFGCNLGGSIFDFLMRYENLDFLEALKILAEKAGLELKGLREQPPELKTEKNYIFDINKVAAKYFSQNLTKEATAYLRERGLSYETISEFQIGFAPERDHLLKLLKEIGIADDFIVKSGLFFSDGFELKPRFRSRIMFPIADRIGRIVGFTGRVFPEITSAKADQPVETLAKAGKYVNTPETSVFKKGELLYGLDKALPQIRESQEVILTEGQMDFLLAWEKGVRNIVATSSAYLTNDHLKLLKRLAKKFVLAFDNDEAGRRGTLQSAIRLLRLGCEVFWLEFQAKDLGEWFLINQEVRKSDFLEVYYKTLKERYEISELTGRRGLIAEFLPFLSALTDGVTKDFWVKRIAEELRIQEAILLEEIAKVPVERFENLEEVGQLENSPGKTSASRLSGLIADRYQTLLTTLLSLAAFHRHPNVLETIREEIKPEDYNRYRAVEQYLSQGQRSEEVDIFILRGEYESGRLENWEKELGVLVRELKREFYHQKIAEIERKLKEESDNREFLLELSRCSKKLRSLQ